ncbi:DUF1801 domain-containing protein [Rhodococcus sp. H36-A4]|uniref:DUF1801 domain-containing protein n=1 Tax=Rhodococcus sp. H36-A4 TaxID=3004353 RepID=UPI0022AE5902|nr:DUF1801 domain-containing protein [Rhodococcus sp. H36-A4]MCZ4079165.1 DUF1801 domain-containing protein [Rhodococcus sp. H36-A4]
MAENKTGPTGVDVLDWLRAVEHPVRRADGLALHEMMSLATGVPAVMWGPTMVGFGQYHYRYDSGREGDALAVGFSPRKASLALYGLTYAPKSKALLDKLGKHKTGAGCLYINKLSDVDVTVLQAMIEVSYPYVVGNLAV